MSATTSKPHLFQHHSSINARDIAQKPADIISASEALLVRFSADDSMGFKGFSASYVAVSPFDGGAGFDDMKSDSAEMTPFPGYLQSVVVSSEEETAYNYDDNIELPIGNNRNNYNNNHQDPLSNEEDEHDFNSNVYEHYS